MQSDDRAALQSAAHDAGTDRERVPVAGGVLVYETRETGRELVGFEDVTDWDALRSGLAARGHAVGAVHHKPVLDGGGR